MNHYFSKTILRWTLAFVLFYSAILDLRIQTFFPKILDFYFIFLALWIFIGKKLIGAVYLVFITFSLIGIYKIFILGFDRGFLEIGYALVSLALVGLIKREKYD